MEERGSGFKILTGKPTGKRTIGMPRRRWEDNSRMDLKERGINTRNWVDMAQDRDHWRAIELVNTVNVLKFHSDSRIEKICMQCPSLS